VAAEVTTALSTQRVGAFISDAHQYGVSSGSLTLFLAAYEQSLRGTFQAMRPAIKVCSGTKRPLLVKSREVKFGMGAGMEVNAWLVQASGQALICKFGL
jgi:hypothetical protein